jgi:hypothetical protein
MFSRRLLSCSLLLSGFVVVAFSTDAVRAQRLEDGRVMFEQKARATMNLRKDLFSGRVQADAKDKSHQEAVEMAAKEVTYPLYWETLSGQLPEPRKLNDLFEQFERRLTDMSHQRLRNNTLQMQQMYCRQVIERAREVILKDNSKPVAGINAARMLARIPERTLERGIPQKERDWTEEVLPRLSDGNAEYLAGVLLALLESPKVNDGIKYYLYRGLGSLMALPKQTPALLKKETEEKIIHTAIEVVEKKVVFPKRVPHGEVEGYKFLRREAVKIVAQARVPVFGDKDRPALTLAKVAGNDQSIEPSPRLDERIEAVIGLAKMAPAAAKFPDFQPEYAMLQVAHTVEALGLEAAKNSREIPVYRGRPWKIDAARLGEAVEALKADSKSPYVQQVADQCLPMLRTIEDGGQGDANSLGDYLAKSPVPVNSLFKSSAESVIKPASGAEKEKEKEKDK